MNDNYRKTGYLNSDFKIFHLIDKDLRDFDYHYHDFYKILIFISGNVSYIVEGRQYALCPYDMIILNTGEIHKPVIHDNTPYERIILYISPDFFTNYHNTNYDLFHCFNQVYQQQSNLIRISDLKKTKLYSIIYELCSSLENEEYAFELYQKIKFIEYLILLNRIILTEHIAYTAAITANPTVLAIIKYINNHLTEDISIDTLADAMYLNRSYIMHLFKAETGYTIGNYITEKRLFIAKQLILNGNSITDACYESGFKNYASFYHAFKNKYHVSPKNIKLLELS